MRIGFLGCGKIAEPMVRSLSRRFADTRIYVSTRSESISGRLTAELDNVRSGGNQWVVEQSEVVVLSMLAGVAREVLAGLEFGAEQKIISVMADISLDEVGQLVAPASEICLTVPLPFIETGGCPLPVFPESREVTRLFGDENPVIVLADEGAMGPHFAATAILSTLMAQLDCVGNWLGEKTGSRASGEIYVVALVSGYLGAMEKDGRQRFVQAMQDLSTEGGLNTQLLAHNLEGGMIRRLEQGLDMLVERLGN